MYLDGQLPYGPDTSNVGAPLVPTFDTPGTPQTYTTDGGPSVISPTQAVANGVVPTPPDTSKTPAQGVPTDSATYSGNGDYAADGSLASIRNRRPTDPLCGIPGAGSGVSGAGMALFFGALAGLMLLTSKGGK